MLDADSDLYIMNTVRIPLKGKLAQSAKEWVSFQQIIKCNML
jgi:hypothetical protein